MGIRMPESHGIDCRCYRCRPDRYPWTLSQDIPHSHEEALMMDCKWEDQQREKEQKEKDHQLALNANRLYDWDESFDILEQGPTPQEALTNVLMEMLSTLNSLPETQQKKVVQMMNAYIQ